MIWLISLFFLIFSFFWYYLPITSYFSQDDFFHLRLIMDKSLGDIPWFLTNFLEGQTFYRPISREIYNLIIYKLFGLNALPFHVFNLLLIFINLILFFILMKKLINDSMLPFFVSFIYLFSSIHSIELYYLASVQTLFSSTFILISLIFYINFSKTRKINFYLSAILFFLIALLCHESSVILPGIIFILGVATSPRKLSEIILYTIPFVLLAVTSFFSIMDLSTLPKQQVYQPVFHFKTILNTLGWYTLWSFGLPEMMVDFVKPKLIIKDEFIQMFGDYAKIVIPLLFSFISLLILKVWLFKKRIFSGNLFIFSIIAFLISLLPFLFFPQHKFVYYLSLPILFFATALGIILTVSWHQGILFKISTLTLMVIFIIISYQTNSLNFDTHWAAKRARAAKSLIEKFTLKYPSVPRDSTIYIMDDPNYPDIAKEWGTSSKQAFYILSGSDALQLLYKDSSIGVCYQGLNCIPNKINSKNIYKFTANFPY